MTTHGLSKRPERGHWQAIKTRCYNANYSQFHDYGGRGIRMCDRWLHSFEAFYNDLGPRPSTQHSVERNDNNGHYEPSNCSWATRGEQNRNRRNNRRLTFQGRTQCLANWADELGVDQNTLRERLEKGWPLHIAFARHVVAVLMLADDPRIQHDDVCLHPRNVSALLIKAYTPGSPTAR